MVCLCNIMYEQNTVLRLNRFRENITNIHYLCQTCTLTNIKGVYN